MWSPWIDNKQMNLMTPQPGNVPTQGIGLIQENFYRSIELYSKHEKNYNEILNLTGQFYSFITLLKVFQSYCRITVINLLCF